MRLLIADDDPVSRRVLERIVLSWGYHPILAADGKQALDLLQQADPPRLAILDWMMPHLDGPKVCASLRAAAREPYIYAILVTARHSSEDLVTGMNAGADDYIRKPFNEEELRARVRAGERIIRLHAELVEAREELRFRATYDGLTKLLNHRAFLEAGQSEVSRCGHFGQKLGLIMMDLDHFKQVNDQHGHQAGDLVLWQTAEQLRAHVRPYDHLGRLGGEEFAVAVPQCGIPELRILAERLRSGIESMQVSGPSAEICVTGSFGIAEYVPGQDLGFEKLLKRADAALYHAKSHGRNRVEELAIADSL